MAVLAAGEEATATLTIGTTSAPTAATPALLPLVHAALPLRCLPTRPRCSAHAAIPCRRFGAPRGQDGRRGTTLAFLCTSMSRHRRAGGLGY